MAITLLINGRPLQQGQGLGVELRATAQDLRDISLRKSSPAHVATVRRERLIFRDALQYLLEKGRINEKEEEAGMEIKRVHSAVVGSGPRMAQVKYGEPVDCGEPCDLPLALMPAHANRYAPWKQWSMAKRASRRSSVTLFDVSIAVCFDNLGNDQVAERLNLHPNTVMRALQLSLWQYCLIGEWVTEAA